MYITRILPACSNAANRIISCAHMGGTGGRWANRGGRGFWRRKLKHCKYSYDLVLGWADHVVPSVHYHAACRAKPFNLPPIFHQSSTLDQHHDLRRSSGRDAGPGNKKKEKKRKEASSPSLILECVLYAYTRRRGGIWGFILGKGCAGVDQGNIHVASALVICGIRILCVWMGACTYCAMCYYQRHSRVVCVLWQYTRSGYGAEIQPLVLFVYQKVYSILSKIGITLRVLK